MVYVLSRIKCAIKADQKIATHGKTSVFNDVAGDLDARMSKAFADRGVLVILVDLALGPTQLLAEAVDGYAVISDLLDTPAVSKMAANQLAQSGVLNILVNNASILSNATIATSLKQKWRRVQDVNVDASFILAHSFLPRMRAARWCGVINMFSSAAKSGGLTAVTFYPGPKSAMRDDLLPRSRSSGKDRHIQRCSARQCDVTNGFRAAPRGAQLAANLVGCFCEPEEVAHAVKVFASRLAGFITSEVIDPNGGLHND